MVSSTTARVNFSRSMSSAPLTVAPLHLGRQFVLGCRIERQQIERPEQRGGGRLVAGEDHGRDLIAELFVGEGFAGFGIARSAHQIEQVARRRAFVLAGGAAFGHQHGRRTRSSACGNGRGRNPAGSASSAAAAGRENAAAPAARHTPSRSRATRRHGDPSRTRTSCARQSRASSCPSRTRREF